MQLTKQSTETLVRQQGQMTMKNKVSNQMARHDVAANLTRLAMRLQRASADSIPGILQKADDCLARYKALKVMEGQPAGETIDQSINDEATMHGLAQVIGENVAPHGFALLVFSRDDSDVNGVDAGRVNYVSNCDRDDICKVMTEFIVAHEASKS